MKKTTSVQESNPGSVTEKTVHQPLSHDSQTKAGHVTGSIPNEILTAHDVGGCGYVGKMYILVGGSTDQAAGVAVGLLVGAQIRQQVWQWDCWVRMWW